MMKFVETVNGTFVNVEDISIIDYEVNSYITSYVILKNEAKLPFLEIPQSFVDKNGDEHEVEVEDVVSLHRHVIDMMCRNCYFVLKLEEINQAWEKFIEEFNMKNVDKKVS